MFDIEVFNLWEDWENRRIRFNFANVDELFLILFKKSLGFKLLSNAFCLNTHVFRLASIFNIYFSLDIFPEKSPSPT
jgi:hypothetical protein